MSRERKTIPILGIDERPNERQTIPGLAEGIKNLRPDGIEQQPYWTPIGQAEELVNDSDSVFTHTDKETIVQMYWHTRGKVGKYGDAGSLKRLVILFSNGTIEIVDPNLSGWETVATYSATSSNSGYWGMSYTQMYDTGYICLSKGNLPVVDVLLEDDLLIENVFPELPVTYAFSVPSKEKYTNEEIEGGLYKGFVDRFVYVRYAFRLADGTLVKHSVPERVRLSKTFNFAYSGESDPDVYTAQLAVHLEGYGQTGTPTNFDYWKDKISGVTVLVSEPINIFGGGDLGIHLEQTSWFEVYGLDSIDSSELKEDVVVTDISDNDFATYSVADVDDGTNHSYARGVALTYNSRLILGSESTFFSKPKVNIKETINPIFVYKTDGAIYQGEDSGLPGGEYNNFPESLVVVKPEYEGVVVSNEINCEVTRLDSGQNTVFGVDVPNGSLDWSFTFLIGDNYSISVSKNDYLAIEDGVLSSSLIETIPDGSKPRIRLGVELDTDNGLYEVLSDVFTIQDIRARYYPHSFLLSYPDLRANKIIVYADLDNNGTFYRLQDVKLTQSQKANLSTYTVKKTSLFSYGDITTDLLTAYTTKLFYKGSKVQASVINSFLAFESDLTYFIGNTSDRVTGFAVNSLEVSQGQFGQYPLFIFKENSVWALEQSGSPDVVFGRITPIDSSVGVDSEFKITNVGTTVFFAHSSGIYVLAGSSPQRISEQVRSIHDDVQRLGYFRSSNDKELLVALSNGVYRYSMKYKTWYRSTEIVDHFFSDNDKLYGFNSDNTARDYQEESEAEVSTTVVLDNVHFGYPDTLKRFFFFYLRGEVDEVNASKFAMVSFLGDASFSSVTNNIGKKALRIKYASVYSAKIVINATMLPLSHQIHKIDTEFSVRYPRKMRD